MKKFLYTLLMATAVFSLAACQQQEKPKKAKYVFYFITDGTGVNTILGQEMMQYELENGPGKWGRVPLCVTQFPVISVASTYSHSHGVTDSASSGTALACGVKTSNGMIGEGPDSSAVYSIATWAHELGIPTAVGTSVCINHATPASFYAHADSRKQYYKIGSQLAEAGFDFYGGSDINKACDSTLTCYQIAENGGYTIARGVLGYDSLKSKADKMLLLQRQEESDVDPFSLPYYLDAKPGQMTVIDILRAQIDFLYNYKGGKDKGFFIMNEIGAKVDFGCHSNDAAAAFREVAVLDSCIRVAYDFYLQHPDETLILLTADHETGGLVLAKRNSYVHNLQILQYQTASKDEVTRHFQALRAQTGNKVTWEQVQAVLKQDFSFWDKVDLSEDEEKDLKELYRKSFVGKMPNEKNLYSSSEPMAAEAVRIINAKAHVSWSTGGHSAGLVPCYVCGVGAEQFMGHNDNAEIPIKIARIAGYK